RVLLVASLIVGLAVGLSIFATHSNAQIGVPSYLETGDLTHRQEVLANVNNPVIVPMTIVYGDPNKGIGASLTKISSTNEGNYGIEDAKGKVMSYTDKVANATLSYAKRGSSEIIAFTIANTGADKILVTIPSITGFTQSGGFEIHSGIPTDSTVVSGIVQGHLVRPSIYLEPNQSVTGYIEGNWSINNEPVTGFSGGSSYIGSGYVNGSEYNWKSLSIGPVQIS
ncbi:MAG: hypothetical protein KGL95_05290, partial [Patescibacteria group bacterium]|nr:hypothetical protein [Patescibacteria group bacterium]